MENDDAQKLELVEGCIIAPLKLRHFCFKAENADGVVEDYIIEEMTGAKRDDYLKLLGKKMRRNQQTGKIVDYDPQGMQALILAMSCSKVLLDGSKEVVTSATFQSWGAGVLEALSEKALVLSGLNKTAREDEEKN